MAAPFIPLTAESDWHEALEASDDTAVLIFKHSSACPVSAQADEEMTALVDETDLPTYKVVVQEARPVSDAIEAALDIRHETPQAIVLRNREPLVHASHFDVTAETLRDELSATSVSTD